MGNDPWPDLGYCPDDCGIWRTRRDTFRDLAAAVVGHSVATVVEIDEEEDVYADV